MVAIPPFVGMHLTCLTVVWVGWSLVAVLVAVLAYFVRMFAITGFYHTLLLASLVPRPARRPVRVWRARRRGRAARAGLVGRAPPPSPRLTRPPRGRALADRPRLHPLAHGLVPDAQGFSHPTCGACATCRSSRSCAGSTASTSWCRWYSRFGMFGLGALLDLVDPDLGTSSWQMLVWGFFISTRPATTAPTPSTRSHRVRSPALPAPATPAATTGCWR